MTLWKRLGVVLGVLFLACWAVIVAAMLVDLARRGAGPLEQATNDQVLAAIVGLALLIFVGLLVAFRSEAAKASAPAAASTKGAYRAQHASHPNCQCASHPQADCPTCHAEMKLLGARYGLSGTDVDLYLWKCRAGHGWARQGRSFEDATYPWQACNALEVLNVLYG